MARQDFADLEAAARSWHRLADAFATAHQHHTHRVSGPLHPAWQGLGAQTALPVLARIESQLEAAQVDAVSYATVLDTLHARLSEAQGNLCSAVANAEHDHFTVDDATGRVTLPRWVEEGRADPHRQDETAAWDRRLAAYQRMIDQAVKDAEQADEEGARALATLTPGTLDEDDALRTAAEESTGATRLLGIGPYAIPDGKDPKRAAAWWRSLSHDEQQSYLTLHPELIGALGGLPATARDQANRLLLDEYLDGRGGPGPGTGLTADQWNQQQDALRALKSRLDDATDDDPGRRLYLLRLDPSGTGRAVVAMGNPDTAANTAVLVPGTNTNLASMPGQIDRIDKLRMAATRAGAGDDTSVIAWLGYDPPQEDVPGDHFDLGVAGTGLAEEGGRNLRQFVQDLRAAQGPLHSHLTVIGHSYGSTTVGAAAADDPHGLGADDIVVVGSPGMTVDNVRGLHMTADHVFVGSAADDPVIEYFSDATLGKNPARESFGARDFAVDTHGHSGYWAVDPNGTLSESLHNQGRIIAGYEPLTVDPTPDPPTYNWP
nr:alpha/beta hydrolase [Streptomyces sp. SID5468]